jgi:hypothetical protein
MKEFDGHASEVIGDAMGRVLQQLKFEWRDTGTDLLALLM